MLLNRIPKPSVETALCIGALALLAVLALCPVLWGKTPIAARGVLFEAPWEEARPAGLLPPEHEDSPIQESRYYPWYAYLSHAAKSKDSILWNPLEGCGMPFMAQWRTRCFSPFSLPFYLFSAAFALKLSLLLKLFIAGLCSFYAARRFGFKTPLALAAGVAFEFSGPVYLWLGWPMSDVTPWLPLFLVYLERLFAAQYRSWALGAVVVAVMALGGDPETLTAALIFAAVYLVLRSLLDRNDFQHVGGTLLVLALSAAAGIAIAAFQILPFLEFLGQTTEANPARPALIALRDFVVAFLPDFLGSPSTVISNADMFRSNRVVMLLHVGLVQLWLLPLWLVLRSYVGEGQRHRTETALLTSAVMTLLAFIVSRHPVGLPVLHHLRPEHLLLGNALAFALMAIATADAWLSLTANQCASCLKKLGLLFGVLCVVGLVLMVLGLGLPRTGALPLWAQLLTLLALLIAFAALVVVTLLRPSPWVMGGSLAVLTFVCLFVAFGSGVSFAGRGALFPETPFVKTLSEMSERIGGSDALKRWPLAGNLIPQVYCPSAPQPNGNVLCRYATFAERIASDPLLSRRTGCGALLLSKEDIRGAFAPIRPNLAIRHVFSSGAVLFKDLQAKPRAWVAFDWRPASASDPNAVGSSLPPLIEGAPAPTNAKAGSEAKVAIAAETSSTRVELDVDAPLPGMLILADAKYPGWGASVNGEKTPILAVDGLFRGVPIKEGKQKVVFNYRPSSLRIGLAISILATLVTLLALRNLARHWRENRG